jgi:hypothetical protein
MQVASGKEKKQTLYYRLTDLQTYRLTDLQTLFERTRRRKIAKQFSDGAGHTGRKTRKPFGAYLQFLVLQFP